MPTTRQLALTAAFEALVLLAMVAFGHPSTATPPSAPATTPDRSRPAAENETPLRARADAARPSPETAEPLRALRAEPDRGGPESSGPGSSLSGYVRGTDDQPLLAQLALIRGDRHVETWSRQQGYAFAGLEPGVWKLSCRCDGHLQIQREVELRGPHTRLDLELATARGVPLFVVDSTGAPYTPGWQSLGIAPPTTDARFRLLPVITRDAPPARFDADVNIQSQGARLEQSGDPEALYRLVNEVPLPLHVTLVLGSHPVASAVWQPDTEELRIELPRERLRTAFAHPTFEVVDHRSGRPVPGAQVSLGFPVNRSLICDDAGRVAAGPLAPADLYPVYATHGDSRSFLQTLPLVAGERSVTRLELRPRHRVQGRVLAPDGSPAEFAFLVTRALSLLDRPATEWAWEPMGRNTTSGDAFDFDLPAGRHLLRAHHWESGSTTHILDNSVGPVEDLILRMEPTHAVDVRPGGTAFMVLRKPGGLPVAFQKTFGGQNLYTPAGTWQLDVTYPDGRMVSREVTVPAPGNAPVELR